MKNTYTSWIGTKFSDPEMTGITWSYEREAAPVYSLGSTNPRTYIRGQRRIAGEFISKSRYEPNYLFNLSIQFDDDWGRPHEKIIFGIQVVNEYDLEDGYYKSIFIAKEVTPTVPVGTFSYLQYKSDDDSDFDIET